MIIKVTKTILALLLLIPSLSWGEVYKSIGITALHQSHELSSEVNIMITGNDEIVPLDETIGKMTKVKVNGGTTGWMLTKFISGYNFSNKQDSQKNIKTLDIKNQCLEFGFKEETEGFANCQLELTILEKQNNNSISSENKQGTYSNSENNYMKKQTEILEQQLAIDRAAAKAQEEQLKEMKIERRRKNEEDYYKRKNRNQNNFPIQKQLKCVNYGTYGGGVKCRYQ